MGEASRYPEDSRPLPVARTANITITAYRSRGRTQLYLKLHTPSGGPHDPDALRELIADVERQLDHGDKGSD